MKKCLTKVSAIVAALLSSYLGFGQTYYFSPTGGASAPQNGSDWEHAMPAAQLAPTLNNKGYNGGTPIKIYMKEGTYNIAVPAGAQYVAGINVANENLYIKGAYPASSAGTDTSGYDPTQYLTVLDANNDNRTKFNAVNNATTPSSFSLQGLDIINFKPNTGGAITFNLDAATSQEVSIIVDKVSAHNNSVSVLSIRGMQGVNKTIHVSNTFFVDNTGGNGFDFYNVGSTTPGGSYIVDHSTFVNNNTAPSSSNGAGISLYQTNGFEVKNSYFCGNHQKAIYIYNSDNSNIHDNMFRGNYVSPTGVASGAHVIEIYHGSNLVINNNQFYASAGTATNPDVNTFDVTSIDFTNNTFDVDQAGAHQIDMLPGLTPNVSGNTYSVTDPGTDCPTREIAVTNPTDTDGDGVGDNIDLDSDNDGILNTAEGYNAADPTASLDTDGDGIPDYLDLDSDNDGILDVIENGNPDAIDANGDGMVDGPYGPNGLADMVETAPESGSVTNPPVDTDNDGVPDFQDLDSDNDGINDVIENGNPAITDSDGNGIADGADTDGDGVIDSIDTKDGFGVATTTQPIDTDSDGVPDYQDLDSDNDGINDVTESGLPPTADANGDGQVDGTDPDGDGILGIADGTPTTWSDTPTADSPKDPKDTDSDGVPDYQDLDSDNDGINDVTESGLPATADANGDGQVDGTDDDGDGILGIADGTPTTWGDTPTADSPKDPKDTDGDGVPDYNDLDSDNDSINDVVESGLPPTADANGDGQVDGTDDDGDGILGIADGTPTTWGDTPTTDSPQSPTDTDGDGTPDYNDIDSNNDGTFDIVDAGNGSLDPNGDGTLDDTTDTDGDGIVGDADGTPDVWGDADVIVPVYLKSFTATATNCETVDLVWQSGVEESFRQYEVEYSNDARKYQTIGKVAAKGSGNKYTFESSKIQDGSNYYRLKLVDINGKFEYSKVINVATDCNITGMKLYPNPANNEVAIMLSGINVNNGKIEVADVTGKVISTQTIDANVTHIDLSNLSSGTYFIKYSDAGGNTFNQKLIKK